MRDGKIMFILTALMAWGSSGYGQAETSSSLSVEEQEVLDVVLELFQAYREGDAEAAAKTFTAGAQMQRIQNRDGSVVVTESKSTQGWIDYIKGGLEEVHDEPIWDYTVQIDGDLAHVWTKYALYLGGKFHHCGVDSFLLAKKRDGWKIFHITDTSQTEGCEVPQAVREKSEKM